MDCQTCPICNHSTLVSEAKTLVGEEILSVHPPNQCGQCNCGQSEIVYSSAVLGYGPGLMENGGTWKDLSHLSAYGNRPRRSLF